ncbi:DUF6056 family protein [Helicobacter sp. MIT 21-1697]|uniref:DUF6056 family protein n=1 Tax=Helicobacter sp. MIT 21-1697 TaxID=2993733 RepID=UPI00224B152E|nr:DUF6056 family protein [Helicobacter sp. MIT 21-1697]MCX2717536.1 DUF6056 family protein [Helicobacter sp. MIT 21-1697]
MTNIHRGGVATKSTYWFFGILGGFLFILNCLFPTQSDDLGAVAGGINGMWSSYTNWNGRFFELLRTAFVGALAPSIYFVIINTLVGVGFILSFFVFIFGRLPKSFDDVVILSLLMFILMFQSAFGSIFLWAAGSLNYLWAYLALVCSFIPYRLFWRRYFSQDSKDVRKSNMLKELCKAFIFMILCFIAGMSSEMIGIVAIIVHIGFFIYALYKRVHLPLWYYAGIVAFTIGWFALYLSPGHAKRVAVYWELFGQDSFYTLSQLWAMSFSEKIQHLNLTYAKFVGYLPVIIIVPALFVCYKEKANKFISLLIIFVVIIFFVMAKNHKHFLPFASSFIAIIAFVNAGCFLMGFAYFYYKKNDEAMCRLFVKLLIAFLLFCLLVGTTIQVSIPSRAKLGYVLIEFVMIIFVYRQFMQSLSSERIAKIIKISIIALCCAYGGFVLSAYIDGRVKWNNMADSIEAQKVQGIEDVRVSASTFRSFYKNYGDWGNPGDNPNEWPNTTYAHYFGVKRFVVE